MSKCLCLLLTICLSGCQFFLPPQWTEQVEVRCPQCKQTWTVQAMDTHVVTARFCCTCGRELVLASRPCEE